MSQPMAQDVITEFLIDCHENLDRLESELVELEKDPHDAARLASAFRTIHTIKGGASFLAFRRLETMTHAGESILSKMRDGSLVLSREIASGLLRLCDAVRAILPHIESARVEPEGDDRDLVQHLTLLLAPREASVDLVPELRSGEDRRTGGDRRMDGGRAAAETAIRVEVQVLDRLMNLVGELVLARNQIVQCNSPDSGFSGATQRLNLVTTELQESVMKTRMQPIGHVWSKFPRVVRDVAAQCGKHVRIEMDGQDTDLDKTLLEAVKDPLTHIVRNAVDHGIEAPEVRRERGKPQSGLIRMRAFHEGGQIIIEIADDGAGIDPARIRAAAVERGLMNAEHVARLTDHDAVRLIFHAGFSTADAVTSLSGRGVGMDVVKTNIERIGGQVDIQSRVGEGTVFRIKIPLTLAIIQALVVGQRDGARYAIPQVSLLELVRVTQTSGVDPIEWIGSAPFYRLRGDLLPLVYLHGALELAGPLPDADDTNIVVLDADNRQFGLVVDAINDVEEIVVKPLSKQLKHLGVFAGGTVMGDGSVALILDVLGLAQHAGILTGERDSASQATPAPLVSTEVPRDAETFLVFRAPDDERMAVPLSVVARLEEFPIGSVEQSGGRPVVQYRGEILPLVSLSKELPADQGASAQQAVVLTSGGVRVALAVGEILDVVTERVQVQARLARRGVLGSAVVQQQVTSLVDVDAVFDVASRWGSAA